MQPRHPGSQCTTCSSFLECSQKECCIQSCVRFPDKLFIPDNTACRCQFSPVASGLGPIRQNSCRHKRATATLPEFLDFRIIHQEHVVVSRLEIPARSLFGPLIAPIKPDESTRWTDFVPKTTSVDSRRDSRYFSVSNDGNRIVYSLECDDDCNWMKFVRDASSSEDQNIASFLIDGKVYFATIRDIPVGQELRIRYAENYSAKMMPAATKSCRTIQPLFSGTAMAKTNVTENSIDMLEESCSLPENCQFSAEDCLPSSTSASVDEINNFEPAVVSHPIPNPKSDLLGWHIRTEKRYLANFKCDMCPAEFSDRWKLARHTRSGKHREGGMHGSRLGRIGSKACFFCLLEIPPGPQKVDHEKSHCIDGRYTCRVCPKSFGTIMNVKDHFKSCHGPKNFACETCGQAYSKQSYLTKHQVCHEKVSHPCPNCPQIFRNKRALRNHVRLQSCAESSGKNVAIKHFPMANNYEAYFYKCRECRVGFTRRKELCAHIESRHPGILTSSIPELNLPARKLEVFRCRLCWKDNKIYYTKEKAEEHSAKDHLEADPADTIRACVSEKQWCEICELPMAGPRALLKHAKAHHPEYYNIIMPTIT